MCNGAERKPSKLTPVGLDRIREDIDAKNAAGGKCPQLPELQPAEDFYICSYCDAVWKATGKLSTDPTRTVLGKLDGVGGIGGVVGWTSAI